MLIRKLCDSIKAGLSRNSCVKLSLIVSQWQYNVILNMHNLHNKTDVFVALWYLCSMGVLLEVLQDWIQ